MLLVELVIVVLLALLVWLMDRLVKEAQAVHIELVTARWEGNQRIRVLERKVESQG